MKVFIDPGHGGHDSGAKGNGFAEKDIALDISLRQAKLFIALGHEVKLSRESDIFIPLSNRTASANNWRADVFISNHINAGGGIGCEVWCSVCGGKSAEYASNVEKKLSNIFKSRGVKAKRGKHGDYLYVIRKTRMPAILNEFGFIDNAADAEKLKKEDFRQQCAEAVVSAICQDKLHGEAKETILQLDRLLKLTSHMQRGEDVKLVQRALNKCKFPCVVDGWYGSNTKKSVMSFQKQKGLQVDGIVGKNTWKVLNKEEN